MFLRCVCGTVLDDIAAPNNVEHLLLNYRAMENVQDLVDREVEARGAVHDWPEHWEDGGAVVVWRCYECGRMHVHAKGDPTKIVVYAIERNDAS